MERTIALLIATNALTGFVLTTIAGQYVAAVNANGTLNHVLDACEVQRMEAVGK